MSTFADSIVSQLSASPSTAVAEPPSTPSAPSTPETPAPASTPEIPASPTAPTPAETPANPEIPASEEDFEWPEENAPQPADTTPTEGTPETPAQPATDDPNNWKAEDIDKMLPAEVRDKLLQTQKGRNIYQSYKTLREAEQRLGYRPTVEQIAEMHQANSDWQMMVHEFQNAHANPAYGQNWIRQWFQVGQDGTAAPHSLAVAQQLAATLDTHSPDLYRAVGVPFVQNYIEERYRAADAEQDPEQRVILFNVARILEADIKGKARDIPDEVWKGGKSMQPAQPDPQAEYVRTGLKRIEDFQKGQQQQANNAFIARLNGDIRSAVTQDISYALKPLEEMYRGADGKPNRAYAALQKSFHDEVVQRVNQNPAQLRTYVIARDHARATGDPTDSQNAARAWAAVARPIIKQLRSEYLKDALDRKVTESNQRHAVLQEASQKRGSTSIGQPTEKNAPPKVAAQPGDSFQDVLRRRVADIQGAA